MNKQNYKIEAIFKFDYKTTIKLAIGTLAVSGALQMGLWSHPAHPYASF